MAVHKLLVGVLGIALLVDLSIMIGCFFARELTVHQFGVAFTPDTSFMGYVVGWLLLFVSLVCALALWQVWQRTPDYATLTYLLGFWWIGIGIGIYVAFGKPENLLIDSLKGVLIVFLTNRSRAGGR